MKSLSADTPTGSGAGVRAAHPENVPGETPAQVGVLIVDDQEMVRGLCQQVMESLGYRPYVAESGTQALELLERQPVGSTRQIPFTARIIAATNRDLQTAIQ